MGLGLKNLSPQSMLKWQCLPVRGAWKFKDLGAPKLRAASAVLFWGVALGSCILSIITRKPLIHNYKAHIFRVAWGADGSSRNQEARSFVHLVSSYPDAPHFLYRIAYL